MSEHLDEPMVVLDNSEDVTVEKDSEDLLVGQLLPGQQVHIFDTHVERKPEHLTIIFNNLKGTFC